LTDFPDADTLPGLSGLAPFVCGLWQHGSARFMK
jgi:hypothetical protein